MSTKTINLLPKEEKKRDIRNIVLNIFMVLVILLLLIVVILTVFVFGIDDRLTDRLAEYESTNIKIQDQVNKLRVYSDFGGEVSSKQDIIDELKKDEILWSKIFYDIGKVMPDGAHLDTFDAQGGLLYTYLEEYKEGEAEEGKLVNSFTLNGEAVEYTDILRLVIELKKIENIEQVWIQNVSRAVIPDMNLEVLNFTIVAYWDLEPFLEDINSRPAEQEDESTLDEELEQLQG